MLFSEAWPDIGGQYRSAEVDAFAPIGDLPPHHEQVEAEMHMFDQELRARTDGPPPSAAEAVSLAIWAHMELVRIHPFQEGNGKTGRLLMNAIIMRYVTGPTRELNIPASDRTRYQRCVQEYRQGRLEAFEAFMADLLEALAEHDARHQTIFARLRGLRR